MIEVILIITSHVCKKIFALIFFLYGCFMSLCKWELRKYLKDVSIINDKYLNVVGKYALNQALSENEVFGNPLQSVSTGMYFARLHKFGKFWERFVNRLDKDHFIKSKESHEKAIATEYNNILTK